MSDRNPLLQGLQNPIMRMGVIPGKCQPDLQLIQECMENAENPAVSADCYPGGSKDINHDMMPGQIVMGRKYVRNHSTVPGDMNELGVTSLNGLYRDPADSVRCIDDQFYPLGVAVTEYRMSNPMGDPRSQDPDSGVALIKAGTVSIVNNNPTQAFYPGDWICVRAPLKDHNYQNAVRQGSRAGTVPDQILWEVYPFDHTNSMIEVNSAITDMGIPKSQGGISDMNLKEFIDPSGYGINGQPTYTDAQETAAALKFGIIGIVQALATYAAKVGPLKNIAEGCFDMNDGTKNTIELMEALFPTETAKIGQKLQRVTIPPTTDAAYATKAAEACSQLAGRFLGTFSHGAWAHKSSSIIGRSLNYAAPWDTMHVLLGHTAAMK